MENVKFILSSILLVVLIAGAVYWAVFTIEPGSEHANRERQEKLEEKNEALEKEITELRNELAALKSEQGEPKPTAATTAPTPAPTVYKHQTLINELQKLIDDKVTMREKSKGTRVGTVQKFLNLYFGTNKKVDNDFGATTKADLIKFQQAVRTTADGVASTSTFQKMIEWLKKQG